MKKLDKLYCIFQPETKKLQPRRKEKFKFTARWNTIFISPGVGGDINI